MSAGLYSGAPGLNLWTGLGAATGLYSGSPGFASGALAPPSTTYYFTLEDGSGSVMLETAGYLLQEGAL